jgi:uncharacterized protein YndB with AHSA1/START domain
MAETHEELVLEVERILPAGWETVYEAFTDPAELAKWWGPEGFTIPTLEFDPEAGGHYRIVMQPPDGEPFQLTGEFRDVEPPRRLAFTFAWEPADPDDVETLVALEFRDLSGATEISLAQGRFKTEARRELHRDGWGESFDKLERLLSAS